jgi:hypothetical protein
MKYKFNDKVVVVLDGVDAKNLNENGTIAIIRPGQILGKLSDFTKPKKIKFSVAEKKEFGKLDGALPFVCLDDIYNCGKTYPLLGKRLFCGTCKEDKAAQIEFVKALEHPELIEVVEEKKYRLKILDDCYLGRNTAGNACLAYKTDASSFTQSEIDKMQKLPKFQAIDLEKCKEEAKDE